MNRTILQQAIEQVKTLVSPDRNLCQICHKNTWDFPPETQLDIIGVPTAIGLCTCRSCHDNLMIAIGEISMEH